MNTKWKNYGLYASIAALIPLICEGFGIDVLPKNYQEIITSVLGILVLLGVVSSPEKGKGYIDKPIEPPVKDITNEMR